MAYSYPALPSNPKRAHFQRLLWRAGFAGSHDQITHYVKLGLPKAVTELLTPFRKHVLVGPVPTDGGNRLQPLDLWGHDVPHDWPSWRRQIAHHLPRFV